MRTTQRIPQIQALRALAASLVLIYHADLLPGGYIGVDIFYVISGYLITGILLRELENTNSIDFSAFYARRFKRLLPSSVVVIIFTGVMSWVFLPASMRQNIGKELIAASTYISNYLFAFWNNDYQNQGATPSPFIHFWSLAVEEQFYLFWPIALFVFYKFGKKRGVFIGMAIIGAV
jgi:peptidoglycan/LPS O-acetylase OafA/YrhL